jgi:hypothetical protein
MGIDAGSGQLIARAQAESTDLMFGLAGQYLPGWFLDLDRVRQPPTALAAVTAA